MKYFIKIFFNLGLIIFSSTVFAQEAGIRIIGKMVIVKGNYDDSKIEIRKNGELIRTANGNEKIEMKLEKDAEYYFTFVKTEYVSKSIAFITKNIPEERWKQGFAVRDFKVELNKQEANDVILSFNHPVGVYTYDRVMNDFYESKDYSTTRLKRMAGLDTSQKAENARKKFDAEILKKAEAKRKAVEDARIKADADAKRKADEDASKKAAEEAKRKAEMDAKKRADDEIQLKKETEAKRKAVEEARLKNEADIKHKAELDAQKKAKDEEDSRLKEERDAKKKQAELDKINKEKEDSIENANQMLEKNRKEYKTKLKEQKGLMNRVH